VSYRIVSKIGDFPQKACSSRSEMAARICVGARPIALRPARTAPPL
jgi:hypothetical protein